MIPFTKNIYPSLQPQEQLMYRELLAQNDELLYRWFLTSENAGVWQAIIDKVIAYAVKPAKMLTDAHKVYESFNRQNVIFRI